MQGETSRTRLVGFSFGYDTTMILRDLPKDKLKELAKEDRIWVTIFPYRYQIKWTQRKWLKIYRYQKSEGCIKWIKCGIIRIDDCFGFFQSSFESAITEWGIGSIAERSFISHFKSRRQEDKKKDWNDWITYNQLECKLLVELMEALQRTLLKAEIHLPGNWYGSGC